MLVEQVEALKSIQETYVAMNGKQLDEKFAHPNHKKLDANDNGKVDAHDFELLRKKKGIKNFKEFKESLELNGGLSKEQILAIKKHYSNHDHIMADIGDYEYYKKHNDNKSAESIAKKLKSIAIDDKVILDEAHKIGNKVTIHKGTGAGITGHIGEISRKFKGDTDPTYTIFHGDNQAVTVNKKQIKAVKD